LPFYCTTKADLAPASSSSDATKGKKKKGSGTGAGTKTGEKEQTDEKLNFFGGKKQKVGHEDDNSVVIDLT